jgi:uncharacterized protein YxjI
MRFQAVTQQLPEVGDTLAVFDETGDVFFYIEPGRRVELVKALLQGATSEELEEIENFVEGLA